MLWGQGSRKLALAAGACIHTRNSWVVDTGQPYLTFIDEAICRFNSCPSFIYLFNCQNILASNAVTVRLHTTKLFNVSLLTSLTGNALYATAERRPGQPIKAVQPPFAPRVGSLIHCCHMKRMHMTADVSLPGVPSHWSTQPLEFVFLFFMGSNIF